MSEQTKKQGTRSKQTIIIGRDKNGKLVGRLMPKANLHVGAADGSIGANRMRVMEGTAEIRDPLYNPETLYMPKSMDMYNRWIRHYYRTNELVGNCVDIHATLPFSNPRYTGISDPTIAKIFDWVKDDVLHLYDWILGSALEHTMLGEQFSFATFNPGLGTFDSLTILNPDTLDIFPINFGGLGSTRKFIISMNIPLELRELYQKSMNDPRFREVFDSLDPEIRNCVVTGKQIPIDPNNIFAMQRLVSPYDKRGTSIVIRVLKWLLYEDKLRTAQMATADGHITPIQLWQLGDIGMGYMPTQEDLDAFNEVLAQAEHQDFFQLVTHAALKYQAVVPSQGMMDINGQFDKCKERILIGLYASDAWMGNDGPTYSNGVVALKVLKGRYKIALSKYEILINEMNRKIAIANGFRKRTQAEIDHNVRTNVGKLIIPEIQWPNNLGINENYDHVQILMQLADKHKISWQSVLEELGVDTQNEKDRLRKEMETPLGDEYYAKVVETLLNKATEIKEMGGKFGSTQPSLPGGGETKAPPMETSKPNVRENPENMAIPTGGQEMLEGI